VKQPGPPKAFTYLVGGLSNVDRGGKQGRGREGAVGRRVRREREGGQLYLEAELREVKGGGEVIVEQAKGALGRQSIIPGRRTD